MAYWMKLKFVLELDFVALILSFSSKVDKTSSFDEKRIIPFFLSKTLPIDGHHDNKEGSIPEF